METPEHKPAPKRRRGRRILWVVTALGIWAAVWSAVLVCWGVGGVPDLSKTAKPEAKPGITSADYTAPEVCSDCHEDIFRQWRGTMHSFAAVDPVYVRLYVLADEQTKGKAEEFCAASRCHSPVGHLAGEIPPVDGSRLSPVSARGVFCDFCHTVKGSKGVGNGRYIAEPGAVKRGPYADAVSPFHETAYSKLHTRSEFCGMCHNVTHPKYGTKLETTYDEWKASPYNSKDPRKRKDCQDCHMGPKAPSSLGPRPARAALGGPLRQNVFDHRATGGTTFVNAVLEDTSTATRTRAFLRSAARISLSTGPVTRGKLPVSVRVTNVGAGHDLPTGVTELRQMWVEVTVTDARGRIVYANGGLDDKGEVAKGTRVFHTTFGDKDGKATDYIWFARKVLEDDRIPPKKSRVVRFEVPLLRSRRPVRVRARLLYRSMQQYIADFVFGKGKGGSAERAIVPIVEMASASRTVR